VKERDRHLATSKVFGVFAMSARSQSHFFAASASASTIAVWQLYECSDIRTIPMKRFHLIPAAFALLFAVSAVAEDGLPRRSLRVFEAARLQPEAEETYEPSEYAAPAPMVYDDFPGYYPGYSSYRGLGFQGYCCEGQSPCTSHLWAGFCAAQRCGYGSWPLHGGLLSGLFSHRLGCGCGSGCAKGSCDSGCTSCAVQKGEPVQKGGSVQKGFVSAEGFRPAAARRLAKNVCAAEVVYA
jgi:hypothetical protein